MVTGATGGIGRRVCHQLAAEQTRLLIISRDDNKLAALSEKLRIIGSPDVLYQAVKFGLSEAQNQSIQDLGSSELSINKIVVIYPSIPKTSELIPDANLWRQAWEACFIGPLSLLRELLPRAIHGCKIVLLSGIAGVQAFPTLSLSGAIRSAWLAEAKTISFGLAERGIHINTLSIGGTLTERFCKNLENRDPSKVPPEDSPENIPLGHYADPDHIASVICALLSSFSDHMIGSNIIVDGGLTRKY